VSVEPASATEIVVDDAIVVDVAVVDDVTMLSSRTFAQWSSLLVENAATTVVVGIMFVDSVEEFRFL
jgi:hypothetical protein